MVIATSLFFIAVATFMLFGWGSAFRRLFRLGETPWPLTVAIGMAAVVFIGGLLNLSRIAYPAALAAVAFIGVLLALREGVSFHRPPLLVSILIAAVTIFTIATQLPPSIYNFHDDYQKYFAYPARMVQTGTVFGSPLSAIGLQTLGAKAFLDGFVVGFFPFSYINAVDAVFGLFLCLILAAQFTKDRVMSVVSVASVAVINPQYVNISTLYCGSALMMAMIAVEDSASLGLLYAALVAMKPIYAVFVAIHLLATAFIGAGGIRWALRTGLAAGLFLSPWVLLHAPNYLAAFRIHHPAPTPVPGALHPEKLNLFSMEPLNYGSTAANYTTLVIAIVICGVVCWRVKQALVCAIAGAATFLIFIYVLGPMNYGYQHGLRYFVPVAIALAPVAFAQVRPRWLACIIAAIPLAAFGSHLKSRVSTELKTHSAAAFSWLVDDPDYLEYNRNVLAGSESRDVKALQDRVPAGEPILTWTDTPFYLDYRRNRIYDIDTAGIALPWSHLPAAHYLIWDYDGYATVDLADYEDRSLNKGAGERKDSMMTLDFIRLLNRMVDQGEVLYDDGKIRVVHLKNTD